MKVRIREFLEEYTPALARLICLEGGDEKPCRPWIETLWDKGGEARNKRQRHHWKKSSRLTTESVASSSRHEKWLTIF